MIAAAPAGLAILTGLAAGGGALLVLAVAGGQAAGRQGAMMVRWLAIGLALAGMLAAVAGLALGVGPARLALPFAVSGVRPMLALDAISAVFLVALLPVGVAALALAAAPGAMAALLGAAVLAVLAGEAATLALALAIAVLVGVWLQRGAEGEWALAWVGWLVVPALAVALAIPDGDGRFAALRAHSPEGWAAAAMLALGLAGGGVLAVLPAASGLAGTILTRLGLYVLVRVMLDLAGPGPAWWGVPLVLAGGAVALGGAMLAVRAVAVQGVLAAVAAAQSGLVVLALGMTLAARGVDDGPATGLALGGALFGVLAFGWVQALWAAVAGAIEDGAGSRQLGRLGGVLRRMRFTGAGALAGAFAVAVLPPGAGFVAAWLLFQAAVTLPRGGGADWWLLGSVAAAALSVAGALLGFAMLRLVGMALLGRPRSPRAAAAEEVAPGRRWLMLALTVMVLASGVAPGAVLVLADPAVRLLGGVPPALDGLAPLLLAVLVALAVAAVAVLVRRRGAVGYRVAPAWEGGQGPPPAWLPFGDPATQLGPASFARVLGATLPGWKLSPLRAPIATLADRMLALPRRFAPVLPGVFLLVLLAIHLAGGLVNALLAMLAQVLHLVLVLAMAPLLARLVARLEARMQGRPGPSLLHPWREITRGLRRQPVVAEGASWLFRTAPALRLGVLAAAAALVPSFSRTMALSPVADLVAIAGLLALARALAALAALDEGATASGLAAARALGRGALAEPVLLLVIFALALAAGGTGLDDVLGVWPEDAPGLLSAGVPLGLALVLAAAADGGPATTSELSGRLAALAAAADALRLTLWLALVATLFLPPWLPPGREDPALVLGDWLIFAPVWLAKMALLAAAVAAVRTLGGWPPAAQVPRLLVLGGLLAVLGVATLFAGQVLR